MVAVTNAGQTTSDIIAAIEAIEEAMKNATPGPWKAVSSVNFDSGLTYVSVQPEAADPERDKSLAMATGEYHVCRMSHSAARWRISQYEANAAYIAACNPVAISALLAEARKAEAMGREIAELRAYAHEATKAITGLVGGGSECFGRQIGGIFTADLEYCATRIRDRHARAHEMLLAARRARTLLNGGSDAQG